MEAFDSHSIPLPKIQVHAEIFTSFHMHSGPLVRHEVFVRCAGLVPKNMFNTKHQRTKVIVHEEKKGRRKKNHKFNLRTKGMHYVDIELCQ